jgi:4-amino-4-deoxy-L-arabinose transferase-like glycosyltransferase
MMYKVMVGVVMTTIVVVMGDRGGFSGTQDVSQSGTQAGIPAERVADIVHAVIQADRTFYTVHVVERLQQKGVVVASENWQSQ